MRDCYELRRSRGVSPFAVPELPAMPLDLPDTDMVSRDGTTELWPLTELAKQLNRSPEAMHDWLRAGYVPPTPWMNGNRRYYSRAMVESAVLISAAQGLLHDRNAQVSQTRFKELLHSAWGQIDMYGGHHAVIEVGEDISVPLKGYGGATTSDHRVRGPSEALPAAIGDTGVKMSRLQEKVLAAAPGNEFGPDEGVFHPDNVGEGRELREWEWAW